MKALSTLTSQGQNSNLFSFSEISFSPLKICLMFLLIGASFSSFAQKTWAGLPTGGDWQIATNWNPNVIPSAADEVLINTGTTLTITNVPSVSIRALKVASNTNVTLSPNTSASRTLTLTAKSTFTNELVVDAGSALTITGLSTRTLTVSILSPKTALVNGTLKVANTGADGIFILGGTANFGAGSKYVFAKNSNSLPTATWDPTSTLEITGITNVALTLNQAFGNVVWNCPGQTVISQITTPGFAVNGDFDIQSTGSSGIFNIRNSAGAVNLQAGKTMTVGSSATVYFGTNTTITESASATFTLSSGAKLGIGSTAGITSSGLTGNVRTTTRNFSTGANYIYNPNSNQVTGNGLPTTVNSLVFSATSGTRVKTFSQATTITNGFSITSNAQANLGTGISHTAGSMKLGGFGSPSGTFGSSASTATYKNATFFGDTPTGTINVSTSTCATPTITTQPADNTIIYGANATFTAVGAGFTPLAYAWEEYDGSSWSLISNGGIYSGATTASLTLTKPGVNKSTFKYRCKVTSTPCALDVTSDGLATLTVNKATVTVTAVTSTKIYDGLLTSSGTPTVGTLASGDMVNAAPTQVYDTKNHGTGKTLTPSGLTIKDGASVDVTGNYNITYTADATGVISKAAVTVTANTSTKTYDGTTASSVAPTVGTLVSGDMVNAAPTQVYDTKNQGTGKTLTPSGLTIKDGASVDVTGNYTITYTADATGIINKAAVAVTANTDTKTYDGTTASSVAPTVGTLVSGDVVNAAPTQAYDNKNQGTSKTLTASGLTIKDGSSADMTGNYTITYVDNTTGLISKAAVTVTANTSTKTYDGTTASSVAPTVGTLVSGDVVNAAPTQVYDNKNQGTGKTLTPSGLTIKDGASADVTGNYTITYTADATGVISKAAVTVTANTDTKTYDGTTASSVAPTVGTLVSGDVVNAAPTQAYDNKNQGTSKTLTPSGLTIKDGASVDVTGNYNITYTADATGVISKAAVAVTANTDTKTYDGTTASSVAPTVGTLVSGDLVNVSPTQVFDNKNQGTGKTLTPSGLTIKDGASADVTGNYDITYTVNTTGVINKAAVAVTANTDTKTYDGTTASSVAPTVGTLVSGDLVNVSPTQVFDNKNQGIGKTLTPSGLTIKDGASADVTGNYDITYTVNTTGVINKAAVTLTANNALKCIGATQTFAGTEFTSSSLIGSESIASVTLSSTGTASSAIAGDYPIVPSMAVGSSGTDINNYSITYTDGTLTVSSNPVSYNGSCYADINAAIGMNPPSGSTIYVSTNLTENNTFTIPSGVTVIINSGITYTNNGTVTNNGSITGTFTNNGYYKGTGTFAGSFNNTTMGTVAPGN